MSDFYKINLSDEINILDSLIVSMGFVTSEECNGYKILLNKVQEIRGKLVTLNKAKLEDSPSDTQQKAKHQIYIDLVKLVSYFDPIKDKFASFESNLNKLEESVNLYTKSLGKVYLYTDIDQ